MSTRPSRIVVVGAGIAGSLIATGLLEHPELDIICLEKAGAAGHADAGTGLNIGPNAIKALHSVLPERAEAIVRNSLPWLRWTVALTNGQKLFDLPLAAVADNAGVRIRWAELYALLRAPLARNVLYGAELTRCGRDQDGLYATYADTAGLSRTISGIDLLVAGDGRYSRVREAFLGRDAPSFLGVCLYRLLFQAGADCPIDDYGQWFNGANRLLAFRVPGDFVYCAGSFPIPDDGVVTDAMKSPEALRSYYTPVGGELSRECTFLVDAVVRHVDQIHWARLQDGHVRFSGEAGVLLVGDAAHPMVPTLGQGATQAIEDACAVVDEVRRALRAGEPIGVVPGRVEQRRRERATFVVEFSREATDTMLAGADPVRGTLRKLEPAFQDRLKRLYRDVPMATT